MSRARQAGRRGRVVLLSTSKRLKFDVNQTERNDGDSTLEDEWRAAKTYIIREKNEPIMNRFVSSPVSSSICIGDVFVQE